jgi:hypothetical protein
MPAEPSWAACNDTQRHFVSLSAETGVRYELSALLCGWRGEGWKSYKYSQHQARHIDSKCMVCPAGLLALVSQVL